MNTLPQDFLVGAATAAHQVEGCLLYTSCGTLCEYGYEETAFKLLLQESAPGWLYAVKKGATTIWETWDGINEEGKPSDSLNHYSYGAITGWLIGGVCGIQQEGRKITIKPIACKELSHAKAVYDSPVGRIESGWKYEGDKLSLIHI